MGAEMKVIKGISLFFVYPVAMLLLGFWGGVEAAHYFYPGDNAIQEPQVIEEPDFMGDVQKAAVEKQDTNVGGQGMPEAPAEPAANGEAGDVQEAQAVSVEIGKLSALTEYVLLETDVLRNTEVETVWRLPDQYVGMDREQFLAAMENYSSYPPLSERERGFVGLEVLSFARERVVVRMNYRYIQPGESFYLAVENNEVIVYLEDKETVYINTGIMLDTLPENLQMEIMQMLYVEDEGKLYSFLETYSS